MPSTLLIVRHSRERKSKCSLQHLYGAPTTLFYSYKPGKTGAFSWSALLAASPKALFLGFEGPSLGRDSPDSPLLLLDGTWRYVQKMRQDLLAAEPLALFGSPLLPRSLLKEWKSAYPRRQKDCQQPERGLASIEALFAACLQRGHLDLSLLLHYHWREAFLEKNAELIRSLCFDQGALC